MALSVAALLLLIQFTLILSFTWASSSSASSPEVAPPGWGAAEAIPWPIRERQAAETASDARFVGSEARTDNHRAGVIRPAFCHSASKANHQPAASSQPPSTSLG